MSHTATTEAEVQEDANLRLCNEAARFTPGGTHSAIRISEAPVCIRRAEGPYMWDEEGRRYIDYHAAFAPVILGHCYPPLVERVTDTIRRTDIYGVATTELEVEVSRKLVEHVPSVEQVLLCCTGSEATFQAVRLARAVTGRNKILKFQGCYHGWHDYVLRNVISEADKVGRRDPGSAGMLPESVDNTLVCRFNDLDDVRRAIDENRGEIATIILEPIPHNVGCILPKQEFLEGLRRLCDEEGILLTFDEVITGFRHAIGGYQAIAGVTPDLTTMGKAMANGFPVAAIGGRRELMERFNTREGGDVYFAGTYNGHSSGLAAALATIETLESGNVHEHIFTLGERMRAGLAEIVQRRGYPCTVAGFGSVYTLYFMETDSIENFGDLLANDAGLYVHYRTELIRRGVFEIAKNLKRNHISYSHSAEDIDWTLERSEEALEATFAARAAGQC